MRDIVWQRADTVVWFDLPFAVVMARTVRRTVRRVVTRQELWNGNKEPLVQPVLVESREVDHRLVGHADTGSTVSATATPSTTRAGPACDFVRLRSQREADAFLAGVTITAAEKE